MPLGDKCLIEKFFLLYLFILIWQIFEIKTKTYRKNIDLVQSTVYLQMVERAFLSRRLDFTGKERHPSPKDHLAPECQMETSYEQSFLDKARLLIFYASSSCWTETLYWANLPDSELLTSWHIWIWSAMR